MYDSLLVVVSKHVVGSSSCVHLLSKQASKRANASYKLIIDYRLPLDLLLLPATEHLIIIRLDGMNWNYHLTYSISKI
jgi:hypothetical protein